MKTKYIIFITFITLGVFILSSSSALAVGVISLKARGEMAPYSEIEVEASSQFVKLGGAKINWFINGEPVERSSQGVRQKITLGEQGIPLTISMTTEIDGQTLTSDITVIPALLDILFEAQTVTPPFYRGKALSSNESHVHTMAIADFGPGLSTSPVSYSWKNNNVTSLAYAGNENSTQFASGWENTINELTALVSLGGNEMEGKISIPSIAPSILFYEISPTQGILTQQALSGEVQKNAMELSLFGVPFAFSPLGIDNSGILYTWNANGSQVGKGEKSESGIITLSHSSNPDSSGQVEVELQGQHTRKAMQTAKGLFTWVFNNK